MHNEIVFCTKSVSTDQFPSKWWNFLYPVHNELKSFLNYYYYYLAPVFSRAIVKEVSCLKVFFLIMSARKKSVQI